MESFLEQGSVLKSAWLVAPLLACLLGACGGPMSHQQDTFRVPERAFDPAIAVGIDVNVTRCERYFSGPRQVDTARDEHLQYPLPVSPIAGGQSSGASHTLRSGGVAYSGRPYVIAGCSRGTTDTLQQRFAIELTAGLRSRGYRVDAGAEQRLAVSVEAVEWIESRWTDRLTDTESNSDCNDECGRRSCDRYAYYDSLGITATAVAPQHPVLQTDQSWWFVGAEAVQQRERPTIMCTDSDSLLIAAPAGRNLVDGATALAASAVAEWGRRMDPALDTIGWRFRAVSEVDAVARSIRAERWDEAIEPLVQAAAAGGIRDGATPAMLLYDAAVAALLAHRYAEAAKLSHRARALAPELEGLDQLDAEVESQQRADTFFGTLF